MKTKHYTSIQVNATVQNNDLVRIVVHTWATKDQLAEFWLPRIRNPETPLDHFSHEGMVARLKKLGITFDNNSITMRTHNILGQAFTT